MSCLSLRFGHLIDDKEDPDGRDICIELTDWAFHPPYGTIPLCPVSVVALNLQNHVFILDNPIAFLIGMLG
jgi:hypothetical protein